MTIILRRLLIVLPLLLWAFGCQKENQSAPTKKELPAVTVEEAHQWYDSNLAHSTPLQSAQDQERKAIKDAWKQPVWSQAINYFSEEYGTVIIAPLEYEKGYGINRGGFTKAVFSRDKEGKIQARILKYMAETEYLEKHNNQIDPKDFSGLILSYDWQERLISGNHYQSGKVAGTVANDEAKASARLATGSSTYILAVWYEVTVTSGGGTYTYYTVVDYITVIVDDSVDPINHFFEEMGGGTPSGGTGGNSPPANFVDVDGTTIFVQKVVGIDCASFQFVQTRPNQQEAGIRNQRIKVTWVGGSNNGITRVVPVKGDMVIILPLVYNGVSISPGAAAEIAKQIIDRAVVATAQRMRYQPTMPSDLDVETSFRVIAARISEEYGGEVISQDTSGKVIFKDATYVYFGNNCN